MKQRKVQTKKKAGHAAGLTMALIAAIAGVIILIFALNRFYHVRYPERYSDIILSNAREFDLPPSFLYAVAHTESAFDPTAISEADARGMMQIRSDTWDWVENKMRPAKKMDYDTYSFDPEISVRYGAFLLKILYDEFNSYDLALCAYHAGRGRVQQWLADPALSPDGEQVENIPFRDTNWYVARVNKTRAIYQKLYHID